MMIGSGLGLMKVAYTVAAIYATWNPADSALPGSSFYNGNNSISPPGAADYYSTRATQGKSAGKWYWEVKADNVNYLMAGIAKATATLGVSAFIGSDINGVGFYSIGGIYRSGGATTPTGFSIGYNAGNVIGMALDMDAGTLQIYVNGVLRGTAVSGLTGAWFPAVTVYESAACTANFGASPFVYAPPAGYNAGFYS